MTRLQDWPARLAALIERRRRMPFKYGVHDCCQFARVALEAQTGLDPAAAWGLQPYNTRAAAGVQLARLGGLAALPARCGLEPITVAMAGRGAIVLLDYTAGTPDHPVRLQALGVCTGEHSVFPARRGLVFHSTLDCGLAWRVG